MSFSTVELLGLISKVNDNVLNFVADKYGAGILFIKIENKLDNY
jgi:hypothetical protein